MLRVFYLSGLPYGYLTAATSPATALTSDRLLTGTTSNGGTAYFTTADYNGSAGTTVGLVPLTRGAGGSNMTAPTSPPIREQQYVIQRSLMPAAPANHSGSAITSRGLLSLQDYAAAEYGGRCHADRLLVREQT